MAKDGLFFSGFAKLHPKFRTPVMAIVFQAVVAAALIYTGGYGQLLDWVVFADWIFFGTTALTLVVFRRRDEKQGATDVGFRAPFYPISVVLFFMAALYVVFGSIASNPWNAMRGMLLLAAGVPVFLFWRRAHLSS
jgi:basic amino acid/polyamine antiporter, APA family